MFLLHFKPDDHIEVDGKAYRVDSSFDKVLKLIDLLKETQISDNNKLKIGIQMLFGANVDLLELEMKDLAKVFNATFEKIVNLTESKPEKLDRLGNVIPEYKKDEENYYSLSHDAEYIFSSFFQAYGIDLIEEQGKLSWDKFQALLAGLPENTKFKEVVSIRAWKKPSKNDSEAKRMAKLQEIYKLPSEGVE